MKSNHRFLTHLLDRARNKPGRLIFAEGGEMRAKEASEALEKAGFPRPYLLESPRQHPHFEDAVREYAKLRECDTEEATEKTSDPHVLATLLLKMGYFDGLITGPTATSKERILPALQLIKTESSDHKASSFFIMVLREDTNPDAANGGVLIFADCALNIAPDTDTIAQIAVDSAKSAEQLGLEPKVAMLSFSTAGSSDDPHAQIMREAANKARIMNPNLCIEGEIQADAALIDSIAEIKDPNSALAGHANVLIFPDLESGNIAYKLVERLADAKAIGPILQGLKKPVNEVSRGASSDDIFWTAVITHILTQSS